MKEFAYTTRHYLISKIRSFVNLPNQLFHWLEQCRSKSCHRQLLVITGKEEWVKKAAIAVLDPINKRQALWVGSEQLELESISIKNYRSKLGHEYEWVILDCFSGFRANAAIALSGTIKAHGIMVILCPEFSEWPRYKDPEKNNRISYGYQFENTQSIFVKHLISCFKEDKAVAILSVDDFYGQTFQIEFDMKKERFKEQEIAIENICKVAQGHRNRPLVLTADRGRGKSSALGIAAAQLMRTTVKTIYITAPQIHNIEQVFTHNKRLLPNALVTEKSVVYQSSSLIFKPIDKLLLEIDSADLVLVDEASAIPVNILYKLAEKFPRIIFSSTVHGYEGSGRGFELKFKQQLKKIKPEYKTQHLSEPIRWFQGDVLEQFWFNTLFSNSIVDYNQQLNVSEPILIEYQEIDSLILLKDKKLLANIFEMLVAAHYQTSPDDLQRLLDSPESKIFVATHSAMVIGVAQLVEEGGEKLHDIANQIATNTKRVKGHLVAQNIAASYNVAEFCRNKQWRISRIAILPSHQRLGHGSGLLDHIEEQAKKENIKFLTTAFGCNTSLLNFWLRIGYCATKLSLKPEVSSGEFSCICIKSLSESTAKLTKKITKEFNSDLIFHMDRELYELSTNVLYILLSSFEEEEETINNPIIEQFVSGTRSLSGCKRLLVHALLGDVRNLKNLALQERMFIVALLFQNKSLQEIKDIFKLTGKKQIEDTTRKIMSKVLSDGQ